MARLSPVFLITGALLLWLGYMSVFVVQEHELAIKFRLGEFDRADYTPGLYFKVPVINNVRKFDSRILTLDSEPERYLTKEKKNVIVDSFVKWRIGDVSTFYTNVSGDIRLANLRLAQVVKDGLRSEFGKRTIQEAISGERSEIMDIITNQIREQSDGYGVKVVDVRIKRIELPSEVSSSVYDRMQAERARVAKDLRSRGYESAERIRADAERQRTIIVAEAYRESEQERGEGDGKAAEIYAQAFSKDEQFYDLYRSLNAYKNVFNRRDDLMVLDPGAEFFKFFKNANGAQ